MNPIHRADYLLAAAWGFIAIVSHSCALADMSQVSGYVAVEGRNFFQSPFDSRQEDANLSFSAEPEYYRRWNDGEQSFTFKPFFRIDQQDDERTHFDIRELKWVFARSDVEVALGISKVFWGVTEAYHLVDIINQTDLVENPDGEKKLGQPMLKFSLEKDWGTVDAFFLPGFRERTFPGPKGRLRSHPIVDTDHPLYESAAEDKRLDVALRWSHYLGDWDIGVAHFHGTSREPTLIPAVDSQKNSVLRPFYEVIDQTSLDLQATKGDWLWKLEAIYRSGQGDSFYAFTGGFEYTRVGVFGTDGDLGILGEIMYDERGDAASSTFNNDFFAGLRWTANDEQSSELLTGFIIDWDNQTTAFNLEGSRRLGQSTKLSIQARGWFNVADDDPTLAVENDDYLEIELAHYF